MKKLLALVALGLAFLAPGAQALEHDPLTYDKSTDAPNWFLRFMQYPMRGPVQRIVETQTYKNMDGKIEEDSQQRIYTYSRNGKIESYLEKSPDVYSLAKFTWKGKLLKHVSVKSQVRTYPEKWQEISYDHDKDGCLIFHERIGTFNDKNEERRQTYRFKCEKLPNGGTRRARVDEPKNYDDFDADGKVIFVSRPNTMIYLANGTKTGLMEDPITYERKGANGALFIVEKQTMEGRANQAEMKVFYDERNPPATHPMAGWMAAYMVITEGSPRRTDFKFAYDGIDRNLNWMVQRTYETGKDFNDWSEALFLREQKREITYYK